MLPGDTCTYDSCVLASTAFFEDLLGVDTHTHTLSLLASSETLSLKGDLPQAGMPWQCADCGTENGRRGATKCCRHCGRERPSGNMFGSLITMAAIATVLSGGVATHERATSPQVLQLSILCSALMSCPFPGGGGSRCPNLRQPGQFLYSPRSNPHDTPASGARSERRDDMATRGR
jgi:hypothetical protein